MATVSGTVRAEPVERVRLVYSTEDATEAPASEAMQPAATACPSTADFVDAVRERLRHGSLADANESAREYRVRLRHVGARYAARLDFAEADGTPRAREVGAENCADAARAIALVTALAIDASGTEAAGGAQDADGLLSASEALGLVDPNVPTPPAPAARVAHPMESSTPSPIAATRERSAAPLRVDLGVRATLTSPKGPEVLPGAEVFVGLRAVDDGWLLELGAAGERGWQSQQGPGSARFSFVGARLHGCAFPWKLGERFRVLPCAFAEGGALVAEGIIESPTTQVDPWFALGAAGRLVFRLGTAVLQFETGPVFPTTQKRFVFGPPEPSSVTVHDVPLAGVYAALGGAL